MAQKRCHYEVLQVSRSASPEQIAEAYRKLAKQYHPDLHPNDPHASKQFKRVTKAFDVLSDPERRAKYDEKLARRERAANTAPEPPPAPEENPVRDTPQEAAPQPETQSAADRTYQTATESVSILRSWIIALQHLLKSFLSFSSEQLRNVRITFVFYFILSCVAIPGLYFLTIYETPESKVRSLLARAEVKMKLGDLDGATQLLGEATNIEGANNLNAAKKLLDAIIARRKASAEAKEEAERKANEEAERTAKEEAERTAKEADRTIKVRYWPNGRKRSETYYKNGKKEGLETWWHENGQKHLEGYRKNNELEGLATMWHDNGHKGREGHYKNGERSGLYTEWYKNGQKEVESHYKEGKQDGLRTVWDVNGNKTLEIEYKDGQQISRKEF